MIFPMTAAPKVAILLVNWNARQDTLDCLASLEPLRYSPESAESCFEVIVIDNASEDGSPAAIRQAYPPGKGRLPLTLLESGENLGFVGGNNLGLEQARRKGADYALLLNTDTEVAPDFLAHLVAVAEGDPQVGIVGPLIYYHARPDTVWSAGGNIHWNSGDTHMLGIGEVDQGQFGPEAYAADFVTGCALLIKMSVVEKVGPLDPLFFAYYEETEWCVRVRRAGYKILVAPQAKVWHKISPEAREASPRVHYYMSRNRLLFLRQTGAGFVPWAHTLLEYTRRLAAWTLKPRWRHKSAQRRAMLQAIADYFRGRFGKQL